jgi:hypothetical protein
MVRFFAASLLAATAAAMPHLVERQNSSCEAIPSGFVASTDSKLPDPFTFASGKKVVTQADWACRQQQLSQLFQTYELGALPGKPDTLTASYSGKTLTINVGANGKSISFSVTVSLPSGSGLHPAIITFNGASLPIPSTIGQITFNNDDFAAQVSGSSRGQGKFYTLFGSGHSAGAMMAWAWGVSRVIDALAITTSIPVDLTKLGKFTLLLKYSARYRHSQAKRISQVSRAALVTARVPSLQALSTPELLSPSHKSLAPEVPHAGAFLTTSIPRAPTFRPLVRLLVKTSGLAPRSMPGPPRPRLWPLTTTSLQAWLRLAASSLLKTTLTGSVPSAPTAA